jgi:hypothetical protein
MESYDWLWPGPYLGVLELFLFSLHNAHFMYNAHRRFFPFTEHFCIDNARVIDGKIRYKRVCLCSIFISAGMTLGVWQ